MSYFRTIVPLGRTRHELSLTHRGREFCQSVFLNVWLTLWTGNSDTYKNALWWKGNFHLGNCSMLTPLANLTAWLHLESQTGIILLQTAHRRTCTGVTQMRFYVTFVFVSLTNRHPGRSWINQSTCCLDFCRWRCNLWFPITPFSM